MLETLRAEGASPWFTCGHDEFALVMDGEVKIHLVGAPCPPHASPRLEPFTEIAPRTLSPRSARVIASQPDATLG